MNRQYLFNNKDYKKVISSSSDQSRENTPPRCKKMKLENQEESIISVNNTPNNDKKIKEIQYFIVSPNDSGIDYNNIFTITNDITVQVNTTLNFIDGRTELITTEKSFLNDTINRISCKKDDISNNVLKNCIETHPLIIEIPQFDKSRSPNISVDKATDCVDLNYKNVSNDLDVAMLFNNNDNVNFKNNNNGTNLIDINKSVLNDVMITDCNILNDAVDIHDVLKTNDNFKDALDNTGYKDYLSILNDLLNENQF